MPIRICVVKKKWYIGWRLYMEDAHIATNLTDIKYQLFAILDGHGGINRNI